MKEVLLKNIKYLLSYKLNNEDERYIKLLEKIMYEFLIHMESEYNKDIEKAPYYNMLLNKLNKNIKSIIIPANQFIYHRQGFLELGNNLKDKFELLEQHIGIDKVTKVKKEEILKMTYFYYLLNAIKNNEDAIGFRETHLDKINLLLMEKQVIDLAGMSQIYKKSYSAIYSDGITHDYYIYTKCLSVSDLLNINLISILELLIGKENLMKASIEGDSSIFQEFDLRYSHLIDTKGGKKTTASILINEFLKRIEATSTLAKKIEYAKKLNTFLFELYDYKLTTILNSKEKEKIDKLKEEIKVLETLMIYNKEPKLSVQMMHVQILKKMKQKLENYSNQTKEKVENEYTIYSLDKKRMTTVKSSVQPIHVENKYVTMHILDIKNVHNKVLVRINFNIIDFNSFTTKIYGNLYLTLKELKHLYSSSDLNVFTKESDVIRNAIANRLLNPTIMDIIKSERHNFLGEFIYDEEENRCIIYKNKSIENMLEKVM